MCQVMPEAQARYLMARVLEHQNQPEASRMQLQLALKADPNFADAREFLAELDQAGQMRSAGARTMSDRRCAIEAPTCQQPRCDQRDRRAPGSFAGACCVSRSLLRLSGPEQRPALREAVARPRSRPRVA